MTTLLVSGFPYAKLNTAETLGVLDVDEEELWYFGYRHN